ncbi:hypothetical protein SAMN05421823_102272 [Catalinimonas alkaloidigena]|uniref:Uncharacterized protein n=1 Tax=Catalinimonas alkaloidigena TaxID=1075417 RepID=A0A1G9AFX6_9BACT|nr:hypothetical protein [Catalinimonas alkaloidigena]SDK25724.1 hypothetical protein SAMN05421823_102272 [Catalinimonas alkaloidigena]
MVKVESQQSPLFYFDQILTLNGVEERKDRFQKEFEERANDESGHETHGFKDIDKDEEGRIVSYYCFPLASYTDEWFYYSFKNQLEEETKEATSYAITQLDAEIYKASPEIQDNIVKHYHTTIRSYLEEPNATELYQYPFVKEGLQQVLNYVEKKVTSTHVDESNSQSSAKSIQSVDDSITTGFKYTHLNDFHYSDCLKNFYNALKHRKFISEETTSAQFKRILSGKPVEEPVIWAKANKELAYLIQQLKDKALIQGDQGDTKLTNHWKIAVRCFYDKHKRPLDTGQLQRPGGKCSDTQRKQLDEIISLLAIP